MNFFDPPEPFLEVRVHDLQLAPGLSGLCVGYELDEWRVKQFAKHVMQWLPEFALNYSELKDMAPGTAVKQLESAAQRVYETDKYQKRGEFGELFLHIAIRQAFKSVPAISKIFYKSANNETVKGFDAVHVVNAADGMELWLGEAKFYEDVKPAIKAVLEEIDAHTKADYLRTEFMLIGNKIDPAWPEGDALKKLISSNTSLDEVFKRTCIAVLITYDSECVNGHKKVDDAYKKAFEAEIRTHYAQFTGTQLPAHLRVHLFLLPLHTKKVLLAELHNRLKAWQPS